MKILLIYLLFSSRASANDMYSSQQMKLDSFSYHYKILDSIFNENPYDTSSLYRRSIKFMERLTGIKAHADGNYFGWMSLSKGDLIKWRGWYEKHNGNKNDQ